MVSNPEEPEKPPVWISFPGGEQKPLDQLIEKMLEKAERTGLPVGIGGHTVLCELGEAQEGPDCYSCKHYDFLGEVCKLGEPLTESGDSSILYNKTGDFCLKYSRDENIKCTCDEEENDDDAE